MSDAMRSVLIAGDGVEAWACAAQLATACHGILEVRVVPCAPGPEEAFYAACDPEAVEWLAGLGLGEGLLTRNARIGYRLGTQLTGLPGQTEPVLLGLGGTGVDWGGLAFHHHWLRSRQHAETAPFGSFSPAAQAIASGRFAPPDPRNRIGTLQHEAGLHIHAADLAYCLRRRAIAAGARRVDGRLASVRRGGGELSISALITDRDETLTADLFIDATALDCRLAGRALGVAWMADRALQSFAIKAREEASNKADPASSMTRTSDGWALCVPVDGCEISIELSEQTGQAGERVFRPGSLSRPWTGNCLAIGLAASRHLGPDGLPAQLLRTQLTRLVDLLPGVKCAPEETLEFNRLTALDVEQAQAAASLLDAAAGGDLDELDGLARSLVEGFAARGWIDGQEGHVMDKEAWANFLIALGIEPAQFDPLAERIPVARLIEDMRNLRASVANAVADFPQHAQYLAAVQRAAGERVRA